MERKVLLLITCLALWVGELNAQGEIYSYTGRITEIQPDHIILFAEAYRNPGLPQDTYLTVRITYKTRCVWIWVPRYIPLGTGQVDVQTITLNDLKVGFDVTAISDYNIYGLTEFQARRIEYITIFEGVHVRIKIPTESGYYSTENSTINVGGFVGEGSPSYLSKVEVINTINGSGGVDLNVAGRSDANFLISNIALQPGMNEIVAIGYDDAGNIGRDTLIVELVKVAQEPNPDLKIYPISFPETPTAMEPATVELKIINDGDAQSSSGNLKVGLCILRENFQPFQGDVLDLGRVEAMEPGEVKTLSFQYTFISNAYSRYLEVTLIPEAGMDYNLQNNTERIDFIPLPNEEAYWNCVGEITTIFSFGLLEGKEDIEFAKEIIFFSWDRARNSYGLSDALREGDVRKVITIFGKTAWDIGKEILKLSGRKLIGRVMSYIKLTYLLFEAARNEASFQGCGEVIPRAWETLKELLKKLGERIKATGERLFFFIVDSPADIIVEDSSGRITSVSGDTVIAENIENSFGFGFDNHKAIAVIENDVYTVRVKGTGTGECGLSIFKPRPDTNLVVITYEKIPTTENSVATLVVAQDSTDYTLHLDNDGDGTTDETRTPDTVEVIVGVTEERSVSVPSAFSLSQNYPNPFNATTEISFSVPKRSHVKIAIHNVLGELVRVLIDGEYAPGVYHVHWNGTNSENVPVPSGLYFYRMTTDVGPMTKRMVLLR